VIADFKDGVSQVLVDGDQIIAASVDGCIRYFDVRMGQLTTDHVGTHTFVAPLTMYDLTTIKHAFIAC